MPMYPARRPVAGRTPTEGMTMAGGMRSSWHQLEHQVASTIASARDEAGLLLARTDCLRRALAQSEGLAVREILREFHNLELEEVIGGIVAILRECLLVMVATTGGGALIGGIAGGLGGAGVGALPGAALGATAGAQLGEWILAFMGLEAIATYIVRDMPRIVRIYWQGIQEAWRAARPASLPRQAVHEDHAAIGRAAQILARGHVAMFVLLLVGIVAYLSKGRGSVGELAQSVRASRLGPGFSRWLVRNGEKLEAEPRFRRARVGPREKVADDTPSARPKKQAATASKPRPGNEPPPRKKAPLSVAEKRQLARDFYLKQGYNPKRIDSHLQGIDFDKPVEVVTLPKGTRLVQWQVPGGAQGNYYAPPGTASQQLGISASALDPASNQIVDKVATTYVTNSQVEVLRSTAAPISDTWSVPGQTIATQGGGTQMFSANSSAFDLTGGGK